MFDRFRPSSRQFAVAGWLLALVLAWNALSQRISGPLDEKIQWGTVGDWAAAVFAGAAIFFATKIAHEEILTLRNAETKRLASERERAANLVWAESAETYHGDGSFQRLISSIVSCWNAGSEPVFEPVVELALNGQIRYSGELYRSLYPTGPEGDARIEHHVCGATRSEIERGGWTGAHLAQWLEESKDAFQVELQATDGRTTQLVASIAFTDRHGNRWRKTSGAPAELVESGD